VTGERCLGQPSHSPCALRRFCLTTGGGAPRFRDFAGAEEAKPFRAWAGFDALSLDRPGRAGFLEGLTLATAFPARAGFASARRFAGAPDLAAAADFAVRAGLLAEPVDLVAERFDLVAERFDWVAGRFACAGDAASLADFFGSDFFAAGRGAARVGPGRTCPGRGVAARGASRGDTRSASAARETATDRAGVLPVLHQLANPSESRNMAEYAELEMRLKARATTCFGE
jgi:hypothetical protein